MQASDSIRQALGGELGDHPAYEMIEQFVDGTADDVTREIVDSHREVCPRCDAEIRDLQSFAGRAPSSARLRWLVAAAALLAVIFLGVYLMRPRPPAEVVRNPVVREPVKHPPVAVAASGYGRADWNDAVRNAIEHGKLERPAILAELRPPAEVLRGEGEARKNAAMSPVGVVIDSTTPTLKWRAAEGRYVVSVYDGFERVAQSGLLRSREWRVPLPLKRGRTYAWQVEVHRDGSVELLSPPPAPPAYFRVLDEKTSSSIADARRRFSGDPLLLGVLYARAGMQDQAMEQLRSYAAQDPADSKRAALAKSLAAW
jgi:hypothetical protein